MVLLEAKDGVVCSTGGMILWRYDTRREVASQVQCNNGLHGGESGDVGKAVIFVGGV